ncbi:MAG: type II toxin-antitoxin system RelE family toxin [Saprospiraceae bacterium]
MKTEFLRKFSKDIDKIEDKRVLTSIAELIEAIEQAENLFDIANVKKLKGYSNAFRVRIGDYRVGVFLQEDLVVFARVVHRKDIYEVFP